jgi:hypothetical protein
MPFWEVPRLPAPRPQPAPNIVWDRSESIAISIVAETLADGMKQYPPKPRFALTAGITGHRLLRDDNQGDAPAPRETEFRSDKVESGIADFLDMLKGVVADSRAEANAWFDPGPDQIALVSSLAEGSDRIAARSALARGMPLDVVLPCARSIYEQSFQDHSSRKEFSLLLDQARACLVLPMPMTEAKPDIERAYEIAGLTVLAQVDILIAVWDGQPARGRGGTGDIVDDAARQGLPIVVIDPVNGAPRLLWSGGGQFALPVRGASELACREVGREVLVEIVRGVVLAPNSEAERAGLDKFLATGVETGDRDDEEIQRIASDYEGQKSPAASVANRLGATRLAEAFVAAEKIAQHNASAFRSAFAFNFGAGAFAAACIALAIIQDYRGVQSAPTAGRLDWHPWFVFLELVVVAAVSVVALVAVWQQWHRRWLEARELAERLRIAPIFWRLGAWPRHLTAAQGSWPRWYPRAVARGQPLFSGDLGAVLPNTRAALATLVEDQWRYHCKNAAFCERIDRRLDRLSTACLIGTIVNSLLFLLGHWEPSWISWTGWNESSVKPYSLGLAVFLPAAAAAFYGTRLFGDFEDIVRRSKRTGEALFALRQLLGSDSDDLLTLRARASQAAAAMFSDLAAWHVAVESRSLAAT